MSAFKALFFDLDHTLWDFESNARETISELFFDFKLNEKFGVDVEKFLPIYHKVNEKLWFKYRNGWINARYLREQRFKLAFAECGIDHYGMTKSFGNRYMEECPKKPHVFPEAHEVLSKLKAKFPLFLVTNGFQETQLIKLNHSKLGEHFQAMTTSDQAGVKKPHPHIFELTLKKAKCEAKDVLMVGDDIEADVHGAQQVGIQSVYFNPHGKTLAHKADHEIKRLKEILDLV